MAPLQPANTRLKHESIKIAPVAHDPDQPYAQYLAAHAQYMDECKKLDEEAAKAEKERKAAAAAEAAQAAKASVDVSDPAVLPTVVTDPSAIGLKAEAMLDVFTIAHAQLPVLKTVLAALEGVGDDDESVEAAVQKASAELVAAAKLSPLQAEGHVADNLRALRPWAERVPPLRALMELIFAQHEAWSIDKTGRADTAPTLPADAPGPELSAAQLLDLKLLAFPLDPPRMLAAETLAGKAKALHASASGGASAPPTALITVGAPGSGKSFVSREAGMARLLEAGLGPEAGAYLTIDPDFWLTEVCENENACRPLANWLNHENFLRSVAMRRHMLFDGTGKSLENTCGRVVSRLKAAGYRVHMCIVLASYETCRTNIGERREATGRDVPDAIVQQTFSALQGAVDFYLRHQASLTERTLVYDNDARQMALVASLGGDDGATQLDAALSCAEKLLAKTWE